MSAAPAPIPLEEYLNTDYEPDCDYVEGFLEERSVGKRKHSKTQAALLIWLHSKQQDHRCDVLPEQRVKVAPGRIRLPDICLVRPDDAELVTQPPLLWIEILSPEDRFSRVQTRLSDALRFGVQTIWIIDPYSKEAWSVTPQHGTEQVTDGVLRCVQPPLELPLAQILPE
jgi:Uma2 family endonuclease